MNAKREYLAKTKLCTVPQEQTIEQLMDKCGLERKRAEGLVGVP